MTTNALSQHAVEESLKGIKQADQVEQYSLWQILGIWASAALPMGLIFWVIMPMLIPHLTIEPGFVYLVLITLGLIWQGVVAYILLRREVKPFTWEGLKDRLWLYTPSNPRTGVRSKWLYLWIIPFVVLSQANNVFAPFGWLNELWVQTFPFLAPPAHAVIQNLAGPAVGQWWLLGVLAVMLVFNYLLGEELIFRGILLPKMNGVFGKWDWLANHILFSAYHLHFIWTFPSRLIFDLLYPWPVKHFKSYWVAAIIHGADAVGVLFLSIMAIKGLV
jgi:membrane protease YdiL (CAAX protease family)